jgi:hypothetical protein
MSYNPAVEHRHGNSSQLDLLEQYDQAEVVAAFIIDPALGQLPDRHRYALRVRPRVYLGRR